MSQNKANTVPWYIRVGQRSWWTGRSWTEVPHFAQAYTPEKAAAIVASRWSNGVRLPHDDRIQGRSIERRSESEPRYEHPALVPFTPTGEAVPLDVVTGLRTAGESE